MIDYKFFIMRIEMNNKTEIEKVKYTMYYYKKILNKNAISLNEIKDILEKEGIHISNFSRLKNNIKKSTDFKKASKVEEYTLTDKAMRTLEKEIDFFEEDFIIADGILLDKKMFIGYRGYLDKLILQANHCYENNCFDACAVLMRRILEILLILSYKNLNIDNLIKNSDGTYKMLEKICDDAKNNKILNLSRTKNELDSFRNIGNYAAHKIEYNTLKNDIDSIKLNYRTILEELYYKAGLKK